MNIFCIFVKLKDLNIVSNCLWGIYFATDNPDSDALINTLIQSGAGSHIIKNLCQNQTIMSVCLKVIGNLLAGEACDVDELINYGILDVLGKYLNSSTVIMQKEAAWALSNIAAGTKNQVAKLIDSPVFLELLKKTYDPNLEVVCECVWTVSNTISGSDLELAIKLIQVGVLEAFISILERIEHEMILIIALEGLSYMFKFGELFKEIHNKNLVVEKFCSLGGHFFLEKLQSHKLNAVYLKVETIINDYFVSDN